MFGPKKKDDHENIEVFGTYDDLNLDDLDENYLDDENPSSNDKNNDGIFNKKKIIQIGLAFVALLVVLIAMLNIGDNDTGNGDSTTETTSSQTEDNNGNETSASQNTEKPVYDGIVVREESGMTYSGNEKGSPTNGTGAILLFDYSYYIEKDAQKVLDNYNPDMKDQFSKEFIQSKIDEPPEGTQYSLDITPITTGDEYVVTLYLDIPGAESVSYKQKIKTVKKGDRYYVANISSEEITGSSRVSSTSSSSKQ